MKKQFILYILSVACLFSACSTDYFEPESVTSGEREMLSLTVSASDLMDAGGLSSRSSEEGNLTQFATGDTVGLIVLDKNKNLLVDNVPYKYDDSNWNFVGDEDKQPYYDASMLTYIVYYPYKKEVDGSKSVDDIKSKDVFAPQEDQTNEDLFRQSDILAWTSETGALRHINAELEHLYDLFTFHIKIKWKLVPIDEEIVYVPIQETLKDFKIEFIPDEGEKITLFDNDTTKTTRNLIYRAEDGTYRYLLSAGQEGRIKWRYTYRNETFLGEQEVHAETKGQRYIHHETVNMGNLPGPNMQVSDFYCSVVSEEKDEEGNPTYIGYVFPWDAADRINEKSGTGKKCFAGRHCIGLVVWVGQHEHDVYDYSHLTNLLEKRCHGYVMSLTRATDKCEWAITNTGGAKGLVGTYAYPSPKSVVNDWNGYYNQKMIGEFIDNTNDENWDNCPAANACRNYGGKCGLKAPKNTTGWFLPSAGMIYYVWKSQEYVETALKPYEITALWDERFAKIKDYIEAGEDPVYSGVEIPYIDDIKGFYNTDTYWSSNEDTTNITYAFLTTWAGTYSMRKHNQTYNDSQKPVAVRPFLVF